MEHPLALNLPLKTARQQGQIPLRGRSGTKTSNVSSFFQLLRSFLNIVNRKEENSLSKVWLPFPYLYNLIRAFFRSPIGQSPQEIFVSFLSSLEKVPGTEIVVFDKTCIATDETVRFIKPMLKKERGIKRMNLKCFLTAMF